MLVLFTLVIIGIAVLALPEVRGWVGEKITTVGVWLFLDKATYRRIDNVIVPAADGTTQIDHILVSVYGIFVIETKNMKGWIFGSPDQDSWTQVIFKKKHTFQNPLRQNYRHTRCLSEYLHVDHALFHSVVWFIGDSTFKTAMPPNVLRAGLVPYLKGFTNPCLTEQQATEISRALRTLKDNPAASRRDHLQSLEERHDASSRCPRCGAPLRQRTARRGSRAGKAFLGCARYPACRYTRECD